jgi:predicted ribosomally synthesized peptide with SipW-like signal peptide
MSNSKHRTTRLRILLGVSAAALVVGSMTMAAMSLALFTDQQTVNNTFTSGSVKLNAADIAALSLTSANLVPGDATTGAVVVQNDGTTQLRYSVSTSSSNADTKNLRGVLTLAVKTVDVTTPGVPCDNFDGTAVLAATVLYNGTTNAGFGDVTAGAQTGDRTLNSGANETLCFRISLPSATGNAYQSATTTTAFTFDAEQTANNP